MKDVRSDAAKRKTEESDAELFNVSGDFTSNFSDLETDISSNVLYGTRLKKVNVLRAYYTYGYGHIAATTTGVLGVLWACGGV